MPKIKTVHGIENRKVVSQKEWLAARKELLEAEKELTRRSDELARRRQELPWVRIDKEYRFETDEGSASLADLFKGARSYSFITSCSGPTIRRDVHPARPLRTDSTVLPSTWPTTMSRFRRYPGRRSRNCRRTTADGLELPWASSLGRDFNFDFNVSLTEEQQREGTVEYNYRREAA